MFNKSIIKKAAATIFFSAGRVGAQVELPLSALQQALPVTPADIIKA